MIGSQIRELLGMPVHLVLELLSVPGILTLHLLKLGLPLSLMLVFHLLLLSLTLFTALDQLFSQSGDLIVLLSHSCVVSPLLLIQLIQVRLLCLGSQPLLLLDLLHKLFDICLQRFLEELLSLCVFSKLLSSRSDLNLETLATILTISKG